MDWYDLEIPAGEEWKDQIDDNLDRANLILLLVSADFIASDYCWGNEMKRALSRDKAGEARVIPIILRPVNWSGAPFAKLQALPRDAKPVTLWSNRDSAWLDIAKGISKVVEELANNKEDERAKASLPAKSISARQSGESRLFPRAGGNMQRLLYSAQNQEKLPGDLVRSENEPPTGDTSADEAFDALGMTYHFFWDIFACNSIDDKGMPLIDQKIKKCECECGL